jgi:hypothetical protein
LNVLPAIVTSRVESVIRATPFTVDPNSWTACAPALVSAPLIELCLATSDAPEPTVRLPVTDASCRQVTPLVTLTLLALPLTVLVQAGELPGSTVAR